MRFLTTAHRAQRTAWQAAVEVSGALGIPGVPDMSALGSTNHVYLLDEPPLVFNVAPAGRDEDDLTNRLSAARILADLGVFVRAAGGLEQPVRSSSGRLVTVWERVITLPDDPDWAEVGRLLGRMADLRLESLGSLRTRLRPADDLTDVHEMLGGLVDAGRLRPAGGALLGRIARRLREEMALDDAATTRVLVHGDLWRPNVLVTPAGALLCDVDELGIGPADWDISALLDWRRPTAAGPARAALLQGWDRELPSRERVRTLMRAAHLRRTVKRLVRNERTPRDGYWDLVRLGAWQQVDRDWNYDGFPELHQSRQEQVRNVLCRTWQLGAERWRGSRSADASARSTRV